MVDKVKKVIEELRPFLQGDGGDIEFVSFDAKTGEVKVKLTGACNGCPMATVTLKQGVEARLMEELPEVKLVTAV